MLINARFEKCILCVQEPADSREHVIPKCIGGTLEAKILCGPCNQKFGSDFVGQLKKDPTIRMAVHHLREQIPTLAAQIEDGAYFVAEGARGVRVVVSQKRDRWKAKARQTKNNVLTIDSREAATYIRNTLRKRGWSEREVRSYVTQFGSSANGQAIQLPTGEIIIKDAASVQLPQLTDHFVDNRVAVLIAFEFLALCLGKRILGPDFDGIRDYLRTGMEASALEVLNKTTRAYRPRHIVRLRIGAGTVKVFVQFFEWYVFEVRFRKIPMPSNEFVYVEDLEHKKRLIALSPELAKKGEWSAL